MTPQTYTEFLRRVHEADVARGVAIHKQGDCEVCDTVVYGKDTDQ